MPTFSDTISNLYEVGPVFDVGLTIPRVLSQCLVAGGLAVPPPIKVSAMVDTGADCSLVVPGIMQRLGMHAIDVVPVNTAIACDVMCSVYCATIIFPNNRWVETDEIVEAQLADQRIQFLIGRDILRECLFIYNGQDEIVTLSF